MRVVLSGCRLRARVKRRSPYVSYATYDGGKQPTTREEGFDLTLLVGTNRDVVRVRRRDRRYGLAWHGRASDPTVYVPWWSPIRHRRKRRFQPLTEAYPGAHLVTDMRRFAFDWWRICEHDSPWWRPYNWPMSHLLPGPCWVHNHRAVK